MLSKERHQTVTGPNLAVPPPISDDQFVDRIALWTRDLHEYARSIDRRRMDRFGNQEVEIVQSLGVHAQCWQITDRLISEGRCEKLDQLATPALGPSPSPTLVRAGKGSNLSAQKVSARPGST